MAIVLTLNNKLLLHNGRAIKSSSIYGVTWDGTSTTSWTRTDDAVGLSEPVSYIAGATSYGSPFDNIMPWKGMTVVEDSEAGTMVKIPKFWYLLEQNGNGLSIKISPTLRTDYSVCPACMDRGDGNGERDYILVGRYHCGNGDNNTTAYKSVTGVSPKVSMTRSDARTNIHNLGTKVWQWDWATRFTIWLLYLVEYANWNSQATIGYGCGNGSAVQTVGVSDSMPYHTGTMQSSRTTYGVGVQYRNIEGLWDNCRDWLDGCYNSANGLNIILNPTNFSDSANGITVGMPCNGYPSVFTRYAVSSTFPLFIGTATGGDTETYSCDTWQFNSSVPCIVCGSGYANHTGQGLFFFYYYNTSVTSSDSGSRLMKLP